MCGCLRMKIVLDVHSAVLYSQAMRDLTFGEASAVLTYSKRTGLLVWKYRIDGPVQWNTRHEGKVAGTLRKDGYLQIAVDGVLYQAARIAWTLATGELPPPIIDHANGIRHDNRWRNLRRATVGQNRQNSRARGKWPKGVYRNSRGVFIAQIKYGGVNHYLGSFDNAQEAHERYTQEAQLVFGRFACSSR